MNILCIDTTAGYSSAAIVRNHNMIYHKDNNLSSQTEQIFMTIDQVLKRSKVTLKEINKAFCTIGPGSFTGIRIGVAVLRGLKLSIPELLIYGVSNMQLLDFQANNNSNNVLINACRGQVYYQQFLKHAPVNKIELLNLKDIKNLSNIVADTGLVNVLGEDNSYHPINAEILANYIVSSSTSLNINSCLPLYIRPPDAIPPKRMFDL